TMKKLMAVLALVLAGVVYAPPSQASGMISQAEFEQIFPHHSGFYSYGGFASNMHFGSRREAAMSLSNVDHETGGLSAVVENPGRRGDYCDQGRPYGCPAGAGAYYGRGPIQLSWNYNYKTAGDALGLDLLGNPWLVENSEDVAWRVAAWSWGTISHGSFSDTIAGINGPEECNGGNPGQVADRVSSYHRIARILGVTTNGRLSC